MDIDDSRLQKQICWHCIGEEFLARELSSNGVDGTCDYCGGSELGISLLSLAVRVEEAFDEHMEKTSGNMNTYRRDRSSLPITEALQEYVGLEEAAASDLQKILEERHSDFDDAATGIESPFSVDSYYERKYEIPGGPWHELWREFEIELLQRARFLNTKALGILNRVFGELHSVQTDVGEPVIKQAGPNTSLTHLFRAREFAYAREMWKACDAPARALGPPPPSIARSGRMNAEGISVFYGATLKETALSEIRPAAGSYVAVGRFELVRKMNLLNLRALQQARSEGSVFDPRAKARGALALFLRDLSGIMARPIQPRDERRKYLPTQAIADYLATEIHPGIDGIIYPSAQTNTVGENVVLFNKVSRVAKDTFKIRLQRYSSKTESDRVQRNKAMVGAREMLCVTDPDACLYLAPGETSFHRIQKITVAYEDVIPREGAGFA